MATQRLARLHQRILQWLVADHQRTRGVIVRSHEELVKALQRDKGTISRSLRTLEARWEQRFHLRPEFVRDPPAVVLDHQAHLFPSCTLARPEGGISMTDAYRDRFLQCPNRSGEGRE
jgi:hypothetical protein